MHKMFIEMKAVQKMILFCVSCGEKRWMKESTPEYDRPFLMSGNFGEGVAEVGCALNKVGPL